MKIGIFGGSFDPIHNGHLILAEHVRDGAGLDKVIIIPAFESPFKIGCSKTDSKDRLKMAQLAAEGNAMFEVSSYEADKGVVSYTVDTMHELQEIYKNDELYFMAGTDSVLGIEKWKDSQSLLSDFSLAITTRAGYRDEELVLYAEYLREKYKTRVVLVDVPKIDISSTDVRERRRAGKSIKYLVPEKVEEYIIKNKLYLD